MSESVVRKIQPFTIGTKLSAPTVPKCSGFTDGYLPDQTFSENCKLQQHLSEQVSLYLSCSQGYDRCLGPPGNTATPVTPVEHHREEMSEEDHVRRNTVSPNASSRSIRKITISSSTEVRSTLQTELKITPENINNNNNVTRSKTRLPKIVGVSCENKPNSHFKVMLCKEDEKQSSADHEKVSSFPQMQLFKSQTTREDVLNADSSSSEHKDVSLVSKVSSGPNDQSFAQQNTLFNEEFSQAEAWIREKLQDLRDSSNVQRCSLMVWDEVCQTLQRDLKDFENTLIQLNQMGEQLMCKLNPTSDLVKKRLAELHDQWNALRQTAANQIKVMGECKSLQEFNVKVDRLEAWIKDKEAEHSLPHILGENFDKMQLTRKMLDLKQDEQLFGNLHEEINQMALRLEKQMKTEGRTISTRRKHINKMWLKAQSHLKNYHENLQTALEVSSFYQQADDIVCSINNMRKSLSQSNGVKNSRAGEIRDIGSQIMMLDVSVSQLSSLHPALASRVAQKQSEMKDCWALLQNTVRNKKVSQLPSAPSLTGGGSDPESPSQEPPGCVGTALGRMMGKEMKEEQNRLKGFTGERDVEGFRKPSESQDDLQQGICASDVVLKPQTSAESVIPLRSESRSHPHLHTHLQKFTVSADKTLSWLKDSVAMATQICNLSGPNGFEEAKRHQASLDQDILSNTARIELVKREGHSLVRAQHPGSSKIQEFLTQLEVLWDELKRRHQRNGLVLQLSEDLNYKVVRVLQSLCSLEAWLEAVEFSIRQASLAGDPESVSVAEQESSRLEEELETRGLELHHLRQEVNHLRSQRCVHTQLLPARLKEVEKKFRSVQTALTQQSSELKDTRMLTEFLEKVELEENHYSALGQPLCSDLDSGPSPLCVGATHEEPLTESIGNPVEELREAVEMLNDTARERGRTQSHDQSIQELLSRHSVVSARVERCLRRCEELAADVLEMESEMAVRCEPDRCDLDSLQEYQDQLEAEYEVLKQQMEVMENQAAHLADVCPERMHAAGTDIQADMRVWKELGKSVAENRKRLLQFRNLRSFFRNYLAMISWTEDTRSCIFSENALRQSRENQEPLVEVLDQQIEQKFEEFDQLAVAGKKLFDEEYHLNKMIGERMEELRSMLGWILVHWRTQKNQLLSRKKAEVQTDAIYSELETSPEPSQRRLELLTAAPPADLEDKSQHSDGYEVMKRVTPRGSDVISNSERPDSPHLLLKGSSSPALGGTVNLILSFSDSGDSHVQVQTPGGEGGVREAEPVHRPHSSLCKSFWKHCQGLFGSLKRKKKIYGQSTEEVSTYLHVTDNNMAVTPVYESMTLPSSKAPRRSSASPCTSPYSSSSYEDASKQTNNSSVHLLQRNSNISIFSSLKRKSKKRKKKKEDRRYTVQKSTEEEPSEECVCEPVVYDTHTWPLKERRKRKNARKPNSDGDKVYMNYMKMVNDIESSAEVGSSVNGTLDEDLKMSTQAHVKNHCRYLSLGSMLSFDLPKDMSLIPSIQDVITIGSAEPKKTSEPQADRPTALSTFKTVRSPPTCRDEVKHTSSGEITLTIDCTHVKNISVDTFTDISSTEDDFPPPPSPVVEDVSFDENQTSSPSAFTATQQRNLSEISRMLKEDPNATQGDCKEDHNVSPAGKGESNHSLTTTEIHVCPSACTLIHKLDGHVFHRPAKISSSKPLKESPIPLQNHASHMVLNFRTKGREDSVDSGHSSSGSFKLCAEGPYLEKRTSSPIDDPVHPDHQQFEQLEEELEDIWNHTRSYRQSACSDIMYNQDFPATCCQDQQREPSPKEQVVLFRNLVTASAPNLLVGEFKLPPSVQTVVCGGKQQNSKEELCILGKGDRRSWAAFTQQEQVYRQVTVNETASDPVKLPEIENQQKYIYHYKEEEEKEEKEEETGFLKKQSTDLLSVHGGLEGPDSDSDVQNGRQELPSMEGTLERKHKLQLGGKRAACRGWSSYHVVLCRQTVCFYQNRADPLKSYVNSVNLSGAVCEPSPEYTKKPNCFCLRLRDGSEYLFSAASRFMMKKWILRIQDHIAASESGASLCRCSPHTSRCSCADKCLCSMRNYITSAVLAQSQHTSGRSKEIIVHTCEDLQVQQRHQDLLISSSSDAGHHEDEFMSRGEKQNSSGSVPPSIIQGWTSEKRRSHSFTSATYQRIQPVRAPPAGGDQDNSSSYSVTLFIGDREMSSVQQSPAMAETSSELPLRSCTSLPRPQNKSVFRKFFGKKE